MAKLSIDAVLHNQISGYPTAAEVAAKIEMYSGIVHKAGGFPSGIQLLEGGKGLGIGVNKPYPPNGTSAGGEVFYRNGLTIKMLDELALLKGVRVPTEIKDGLKGLDKKFSTYVSDPEISSWLTSGSEMMSIAYAKTGQVADYGMQAVQLGTMTMDAIKSGGYVTDAETMSIALSSGATVGGMIGSIFPVIGTAVGTAIGTAIGAMIGGIVSAFTRPNFDKTLAQAAAEALDARNRVQQFCRTEIEKQLNDEIFKTVFQLSTQWVNAEMTLGYRFDLRWFDANPGLRFEGVAQQGKPFLNNLLGHKTGSALANLTPKQTKDGYDYPYGRFDCHTELKQRQGMIQYSGKEYRSYGSETLGICNFYCPQKILGCLYPPIAINPFHAYGSPRVIAAFEARGFTIPVDLCSDIPLITHNPPQPGDLVDCTKLKGWGKRGKDGEEANATCVSLIGEAAVRQTQNLKQLADQRKFDFELTGKMISSDLTRTISLMQAQQSILLNQVALQQQGVVSDVALRFVSERNAHIKRMRMLAIGGGVAMAGLALWKGMS